MNDFTKRLGRRLRTLRGDATLREFAPRLGLQLKALHRIETGAQNVTLETLFTICLRLQCDAGELLDAPEIALRRPKVPAKKKRTQKLKKRS